MNFSHVIITCAVVFFAAIVSAAVCAVRITACAGTERDPRRVFSVYLCCAVAQWAAIVVAATACALRILG